MVRSCHIERTDRAIASSALDRVTLLADAAVEGCWSATPGDLSEHCRLWKGAPQRPVEVGR